MILWGVHAAVTGCVLAGCRTIRYKGPLWIKALATLAIALTWPLLLVAVCGLYLRYCVVKPAPFSIMKNDVLYLRRHYLTPLRWWKRVFLHRIELPDNDRDPHDHPWDFFTIVLRGGYVEELYDGIKLVETRKVRAGDAIYRRAEHTHKIITIINAPAWTLVFASQARRQWGFWVAQKDTIFKGASVHVPWYTYLPQATLRDEDVIPKKGA